jgi:hypothetical protein
VKGRNQSTLTKQSNGEQLESLLRLGVGGGPPLPDGSFAARDSFQKSHSILKSFEGDDIDQIGGWDSVLGDEDRRLIFHQFGENLGGIPL